MTLDRTCTWDLAPLARTSTAEKPSDTVPWTAAATQPQLPPTQCSSLASGMGPCPTQFSTAGARSVAVDPKPQPVQRELVPSHLRATSGPAGVTLKSPDPLPAADVLPRSSTWSRAPSIPLDAVVSGINWQATGEVSSNPVLQAATTKIAASGLPSVAEGPKATHQPLMPASCCSASQTAGIAVSPQASSHAVRIGGPMQQRQLYQPQQTPVAAAAPTSSFGSASGPPVLQRVMTPSQGTPATALERGSVMGTIKASAAPQSTRAVAASCPTQSMGSSCTAGIACGSFSTRAASAPAQGVPCADHSPLAPEPLQRSCTWSRAPSLPLEAVISDISWKSEAPSVTAATTSIERTSSSSGGPPVLRRVVTPGQSAEAAVGCHVTITKPSAGAGSESRPTPLVRTSTLEKPAMAPSPRIAVSQAMVPTQSFGSDHTALGASCCSVRATSAPAQGSQASDQSPLGADPLLRSSTWSRAPSLPLDAVISDVSWKSEAASIATAPSAVARPACSSLQPVPEHGQPVRSIGRSSSPTVSSSTGSATSPLVIRSGARNIEGFPQTPQVVASTAAMCRSFGSTGGPPVLQRAATAVYSTSTVAPQQTTIASSAGHALLQKTRTVELGSMPSVQRISGGRAKSQKPSAVQPRPAALQADQDGAQDRSESVPPVVRRQPRATEVAAPALTQPRPVTTSPMRRVFPSMPAPPMRVSAYQHQNGTIVRQADALPDLSRQLRLIVSGLMGSGKSTLCRMLRHLLGGQWVNQDEFADKKKGAKKAFLAEIERVASDKQVPVLLVDKINTMRQHRREIRQAMDRGVAGDLVLVQMRHPDDAPGAWHNAIRLCEDRIHGRGAAHRTLKSDTDNLHGILSMTAKGAEEMADDEESWFKAVVSVNMTLDPVPLTMQVLTDLDDAGLLPGFDIDTLLNERTIMEALEASQEVENALDAKGSHDRQSKPRSVWLWELELDTEACAVIGQLWQDTAPGSALQPIARPHVTLLYIGGGSDKEIASRHPSLEGEEGVQRFRDDLGNREGMEVQFQVSGICWDGRVAAAEVSGLDGFCANRYPHITLATAPKVPPVASNELLARYHASTDLDHGLRGWLEELSLQKYEGALRSWCATMGAASPDEISENADDAAAAMENDNAEERDRIKALLCRCKPGELTYIPLEPPRSMTGRVHANRRR